MTKSIKIIHCQCENIFFMMKSRIDDFFARIRKLQIFSSSRLMSDPAVLLEGDTEEMLSSNFHQVIPLQSTLISTYIYIYVYIYAYVLILYIHSDNDPSKKDLDF